MRRLLFVLPFLAASPGFADVTHAIDARFGVAYISDPTQGPGRMHTLYSGRYTSTFSHESDTGMMFRFELGVEVGNFDPDYPSERLLPQSGGFWSE